MAATFYLKQNDTAPSMEAVLTDSKGKARVLTNAAAVKFHMSSEKGVNVVSNGACSIVNPGRGIVAYAWQPGDTATAGIYNAEFEVQYTNGTVETFPNSSFIKVIIKEELA